MDLIKCFNGLNKLCRHIHLPIQSGSDAVLKRMNRRYTRRTYMEKIDQLRTQCPDIAITSDIIVGFPGETDADFEATLSMIQEVGFDGLFAFAYSDRPNAPAVKFTDKVALPVKKERLQRVLACQEEFTLKKNSDLVGTVQEVLVDGPNGNNADPVGNERDEELAAGTQWSGRTTTNKIVHFSQTAADSDNQILTGKMLHIMIEKALPHCLLGRNVSPGDVRSSLGKGECTHAA